MSSNEMASTQILTIIIAVYAATLSTITVFLQIKSKRWKVLVSYNHMLNMEHSDGRSYYPVYVNILNVGEREVNIVHISIGLERDWRESFKREWITIFRRFSSFFKFKFLHPKNTSKFEAFPFPQFVRFGNDYQPSHKVRLSSDSLFLEKPEFPLKLLPGQSSKIKIRTPEIFNLITIAPYHPLLLSDRFYFIATDAISYKYKSGTFRLDIHKRTFDGRSID